MSGDKKDRIRNFYNTAMITIILALLGYIGSMLQSHLNLIDRKIEKTASIKYVDKQDDYLRLHIVESHKRMDEKLNIYIEQNNKIQELIK